MSNILNEEVRSVMERIAGEKWFDVIPFYFVNEDFERIINEEIRGDEVMLRRILDRFEGWVREKYAWKLKLGERG